MATVALCAVRRVHQWQQQLCWRSCITTTTPAPQAEMAVRMKVNAPTSLLKPLQVPGGAEGRLLLGPGPSNLSPRVREALSRPMLGHLHPEFLQIMDEVKDGLRYLFQSSAPVVCCISGTGHSGMEGMICNLVDEGEVLLVLESGIWGQRAADIARRNGLEVRAVRAEPGSSISLQQLEEGLLEHRPAMVLAVHAESSTGVLQPLQGLGELCHKHGSLLCVDAVASAGGVPLLMDAWQVDAVYTATQKVLSAPPGLAPCLLNSRAREKLQSRRTPVRSFYMDLLELSNYWGCDDQPRRYHHTGPITSVYGLREALSVLSEEGLHEVWERHHKSAQALYAGLKKQGLQLFVQDEMIRAPTVTAVTVPQGVQWNKLTQHLISKCNIEVSGGLGPTAGKVWRIGLMGHNATDSNVAKVLAAIKQALGNDNCKL